MGTPPIAMSSSESDRRYRQISNRARRQRPGPRKSRPSGPWKHGSIPVLGLIGGIGAGKSLVAAELAATGAQILDADAIGHALIDQRPCRDLVMDRFGFGVVLPASAEGPYIDRKALAAIVFDDRHARRDLEAILHPRMRVTVEKAIDRAERRGEARVIVIDAAILMEADWDDLCDKILFVDAPREQRIARVSAQRGWNESQLDAREKAQLGLAEKRERSSAVVENDGTPEALRDRLGPLLAALLAPPPPREYVRRPIAGPKTHKRPDRG